MDCIVHGVTKSQTRLSDLHSTSLHNTMEGYHPHSTDKETDTGKNRWSLSHINWRFLEDAFVCLATLDRKKILIDLYLIIYFPLLEKYEPCVFLEA